MAKRKPSNPWGDRIVKTGKAPASSFLANEANWRVHPMPQQESVAHVLRLVGFVQSVIVNLRTSAEWGRDRHVETLVDGHLRISLSLKRGEDTMVPVNYVDLTPEEERLILATLDPTAMMAGTDREKLAELIEALPQDFRELTTAVHEELGSVKRTVTFESKNRCRVIVDCTDEAQQDALVRQLVGEGYTCRAD